MVSLFMQLRGLCNREDGHKWCLNGDFEGDSLCTLPSNYRN
jgi:hypothetical protein